MIENKSCVVANHEKYQCHHICIFKDCNLSVKWVCAECLKSKRHQHGLDNENHIVNQQDFRKFINSIDIEVTQSNKQIQQYLQVLNQINKQIQQLEFYLKDCLEKSNEKLTNYMLQKIDKNFVKIDNEEIIKILNLTIIIDQNKVIEIIDTVIKLCQQSLLQQIRDQVQTGKNNNIDNQYGDINKQRYQKIPLPAPYSSIEHQKVMQELSRIIYFNYKFYNQFDSPQCIYDAQISQNEKYLAFGGDNKQLTIYDLQTGKKKQEIKLEQSIQTCCFSSFFSDEIYVGCENGLFLSIKFLDDIYYRFKERLHNDWILNIIELNANQVITGSQRNINITDIKSKKNLFKLEATPYIQFTGIDLNKNLEIIVAGLSNFSFRIYNLQLEWLIEKNDAYFNPLHSIQFFDDNHLVTLDTSLTLKIWKLDLKSKSLTFTYIETKKESEEILNFGCSKQNQKIVSISKKQFCFFDQSFQRPQVIKFAKKDGVNCNIYILFQQTEFSN